MSRPDKNVMFPMLNKAAIEAIKALIKERGQPASEDDWAGVMVSLAITMIDVHRVAVVAIAGPKHEENFLKSTMKAFEIAFSKIIASDAAEAAADDAAVLPAAQWAVEDSSKALYDADNPVAQAVSSTLIALSGS